MNAEQMREYEELKLDEIFGDAIARNDGERSIEDDEEIQKIKERIIKKIPLQELLDNETRIRYDKLTQAILNTVDTETALLIMERAELYWLRELNTKGGF